MALSIPSLEYLQNKNIFTGSNQKFNYRLCPDGENLFVSVWYGVFCYDQSEIQAEAQFELTAGGLLSAADWLEDQNQKFKTAIPNLKAIDWWNAYQAAEKPDSAQ